MASDERTKQPWNPGRSPPNWPTGETGKVTVYCPASSVVVIVDSWSGEPHVAQGPDDAQMFTPATGRAPFAEGEHRPGLRDRLEVRGHGGTEMAEAVPVVPGRAGPPALAIQGCVGVLHPLKAVTPIRVHSGTRLTAVGRWTGDEASDVLVAVAGGSAVLLRLAQAGVPTKKALLAGVGRAGRRNPVHQRATGQIAVALAELCQASVECAHLRRARVADHAFRAALGGAGVARVTQAVADARLVGPADGRRTGVGAIERLACAVALRARGARAGPERNATEGRSERLGRVVGDSDELAAGEKARSAEQRRGKREPSCQSRHGHERK